MKEKRLTPKQKELIQLVYQFRFITRRQLQTIIHHKDSRRINYWLQDLVDQHYLHRIYERTISSTQSAIYYLAARSIQELTKKGLGTPESLRWVYRERGRSQRFINHCLNLADVFVLYNQASKISGQDMQFLTKTELSRADFFPTPLPDAYIALKHPKKTKRFFLYIFDEGTPNKYLRNVVPALSHFFDSGEWEAATNKSFPNILCVFPSDQMKNYFYWQVSKVIDNNPLDFSFNVTTQSVIKDPQAETIWESVT